VLAIRERSLRIFSPTLIMRGDIIKASRLSGRDARERKRVTCEAVPG
jgi:hypothetical protein